METDETISVVPYDPDWPRLFAAEQQLVHEALPAGVKAIEHIGSTAVPGLCAKPVIDMLAGLSAYPASPAQLAVLAPAGYECLGEAGVPGRLYCRKRAAQSFNLHLVLWGSELWHSNLLLRAYLRAHSDEVAAYARHKQQLIAEGVTTLLAYSARKAEIIAALLARAENWNKEGNR